MLLRKLFYTAALSVPLALSAAPASADDVDVDVRFGVGAPSYGYGVYGDGSYRPYHRRKLSCWRARQLVRDHGFRRVRTIECSGRVYTFRGIRRGHPVIIKVDARFGRIWRA
jgi:hypothetical protein